MADLTPINLTANQLAGRAVAMLSRRVHPAHGPGGLERHVFDLVTQLSRHGVKVDLFTETPVSESRRIMAERSFPPGVRIHWVAARRLPLGVRKGTVVLDRITNYPFWSQRAALTLSAQLKCQPNQWAVVHAHGLAGWGMARARGRVPQETPLVMTTHGLEEFRSHVRLKRWAYAPFRHGIRTVAARSDAVVTTDTALIPLVERHLDVCAADQVVIPNAVDPEECRSLGSRSRGCELLEGLGLNDASPVFLSVGRIEANKAFTLMVEALAQVAPDLPRSWAWVLVGDGPERSNVQRAIQNAGLSGHSVLAGSLSEIDLHSLYSVSDWFVHPTLYEGSSLATLEAMAHGLPVIASRAGGLPDKVIEGETGYLVPPGNVHALSRVLRQAGNTDSESLGAAGRRLCEDRFSWKEVLSQYLALYDRLRKGRSAINASHGSC